MGSNEVRSALMSDYWKKKVVVITGGSAGFGFELAQAWLQQQARVVLVARNADRLAEAKQQLCLAHKEVSGIEDAVLTLTADITDDQDVSTLPERILATYGRIDCLVNCAGKSARGAVIDTTPEDFRELLELNFLAVVRCTRAFMPTLLGTKGHLVQIGSLASKSASQYLGAYPASKFPLAAYSQQLRLELGPQGLHTLLVCPGPIARADAGTRYEATGVPQAARQPGGGVKLKGVDPKRLAQRILDACESRQPELIVPGKAKGLFAISQISPSIGDWLIKKMTSS